MLKTCAIASGSQANCYFINSENTNILIDCGLSATETIKRLTDYNIDVYSISGIVVTHEHSDHISGVSYLNRRLNIPIYISENTFNKAKNVLGDVNYINYFNTGDTIDIGNIKIQTYKSFHDAVDPCIIKISNGLYSIGIVSDTGSITTSVKEIVSLVNLLYIESNWDSDLLRRCDYPIFLKNRIRSRKGHLSNIVSAKTVKEYASEKLEYVILSHISANSNAYSIASKVHKDYYGYKGINIDIAYREKASRMFEVR